jgi:hypothetical protein
MEDMFFDGESGSRIKKPATCIGDVSNIYRLYHPTTRYTARGQRSTCPSIA